ncbi:MAG: methyltransferase family protein [Promethearchaeota archaeon]
MESINQRGLGQEHPRSSIIQLSAAIIFFLIWILDSFIFMFSTILTLYIPFIIQLILFLSLLIIGLGLIFITGHILFHGEGSSKLIKTGIFAYTRHPLYLGILIIYIGFIFLSVSLLSIIGFIIVFILYNRIVNFEENDLEKIFKEEYLEYKKKVAKWIPFIKK